MPPMAVTPGSRRGWVATDRDWLREVAGWVVSEGAGVRKPDPAIFLLAAEQAGQSLDGAWMIGDCAEADIEGARSVGLPASGCIAAACGR